MSKLLHFFPTDFLNSFLSNFGSMEQIFRPGKPKKCQKVGRLMVTSEAGEHGLKSDWREIPRDKNPREPWL